MDTSTSTDAQGRRVFQALFTVDKPARRVWALMADTQHLNELFFGLPPLTAVERTGDVVRVQGGLGFVAPEYDEHPWLFEAPREYRSLRVFTGGPVKKLEVDCKLTPEHHATAVAYRVLLTTAAGPLGWVAERAFMSRLEKGLQRLEEYARRLDDDGPPTWGTVYADHDGVVRRAQPPLSTHVAQHPLDQVVLGRLVAHIASAPGSDVARLRPYVLADQWGERREDVLAVMLRATRSGLLALSWDVLCPSCEGPVASSPRPGEVPHHALCKLCERDFEANLSSNVEVSFAPVPAVREVQRVVYCVGSPMMTPTWIAQVLVEKGGRHTFTPTLGAGRYRVQAGGLSSTTLLDVGETGASAVTVGLEAMGLPSAVPPVKAGPLRIEIKNDDVKARRVQLVHHAFGASAATAAHVTATEAWRQAQA